MSIYRNIRSVLRPPKEWLLARARGVRQSLKDLLAFGNGYLEYMRRGRNDEKSYRAMRQLFCLTNGRLNEVLTYCHGIRHRPYLINPRSGLIPSLDMGEVNRIVRTLDRDGYYVFPQRVPEDICNDLTACALHNLCEVVDFAGNVKPEKERFDPASPGGVRYAINSQATSESAGTQRIARDMGLLAIAQSYFRSKAIIELLDLWWSAPSPTANSKAAQLYHFDMDRVRFLKFFIYLTDVGDDNGPHCYIAGSHRRLPRPLRVDRRLTDEEVYAHYPPGKRLEIKGPRGLLCAVDTQGLHKGKQLVSGHRLIFQVQYSINLFGQTYSPIVLNDKFSPEFLTTARRYPYAFANYVPAANGHR
jgi:hypothetical protein